MSKYEAGDRVWFRGRTGGKNAYGLEVKGVTAQYCHVKEAFGVVPFEGEGACPGYSVLLGDGEIILVRQKELGVVDLTPLYAPGTRVWFKGWGTRRNTVEPQWALVKAFMRDAAGRVFAYDVALSGDRTLGVLTEHLSAAGPEAESAAARPIGPSAAELAAQLLTAVAALEKRLASLDALCGAVLGSATLSLNAGTLAAPPPHKTEDFRRVVDSYAARHRALTEE